MDVAALNDTVRRAQRGDVNALQELYIDSSKSVYYFALKLLRDPHQAEDMTQDVFIAVFTRIHQLQEPAAYYRWLNQVTAHRCTDLLRKRGELLADSAMEEYILEQEEEDKHYLPAEAFDDAEMRRLIVAVIDDLPVNQRVCIYYYYYEQLTILQIAEMLYVNENTVKSRLALARKKIRAELERKNREEGIKLYGVPLALTPLLMRSLDDFAMTAQTGGSIWNGIAAGMGILPSGYAAAPQAPIRPHGPQQGPMQSAPAPRAPFVPANTAAPAAFPAGAAASGTAKGIGKLIAGFLAVAVVSCGVTLYGNGFFGRFLSADPAPSAAGGGLTPSEAAELRLSLDATASLLDAVDDPASRDDAGGGESAEEPPPNQDAPSNQDAGSASSSAAPEPPAAVLQAPAHIRDMTGLLAEKKALNEDTVGWLRIPGTAIDHEVLWSSEDNQFYQRRGFDRQYSFGGVYYADYRCTFGETAKSLADMTVIYGHTMEPEQADGANLLNQLHNFSDESFARSHPYLYFACEGEALVWEIFAVAYPDISVPYNRPDLSAIEWMDAIEQVRRIALYSYEVSLGLEDKILVLSTNVTTDMTAYPNQRFVVMAKLVSEETRTEAMLSANPISVSPVG